MRKYAAQILALCLLIAIVLAIRLSGADSYLTVESLSRHKEALERFISAQYALSVFVYMLVYIVSVAFSRSWRHCVNVGRRVSLSSFPRHCLCERRSHTGRYVRVPFSRYILGNTIQNKYGTQLERFNRELDENGHLYLLTVRFIPAFPFFLINILSGLTKIPLWTYVWTTSIGILPGSLVYTFAGSQLGTINSVEDLFGGRILIAFLLLAALTLIPLVLKKIRAKPH